MILLFSEILLSNYLLGYEISKSIIPKFQDKAIKDYNVPLNFLNHPITK